MEVEFPWPSREIGMRKLNSGTRITMKLNSSTSSHNFRKVEFSKPKCKTVSKVYVTLKLVQRPSRRVFTDLVGSACPFRVGLASVALVTTRPYFALGQSFLPFGAAVPSLWHNSVLLKYSQLLDLDVIALWCPVKVSEARKN
jgi:hypothetical protein